MLPAFHRGHLDPPPPQVGLDLAAATVDDDKANELKARIGVLFGRSGRTAALALHPCVSTPVLAY